MIFIDNAHRMDKVSWQMFQSLVHECSNFALIMLMQTDDRDRIKISDAAAQEFELSITDLVENYGYTIVEKELPRIEHDMLNDLIVRNGMNYKRSF